MNEPRIEIINSRTAWEKMAGAWNELLADSRANTVFLSWEWLFSWTECFLQGNRQLFIAAVYDGRDLIGAAPWYIRHSSRNFLSIKQLECLGSPEAGSDYLDVIARKGREREVADCLYHFLFNEGRSFWDLLLFRDVPSHSFFLLHLLNRIEAEGKYAELGKGSYCPIVTLPRTGDLFRAGLSPKRRERLRQDLKQLKKNGEIHHIVTGADAAPDSLDEFFHFYNEKSGHIGTHLHGFIKKFASRCPGRNRIQMNFLKTDEKTIAALLHLRQGDELLMFMIAVDKAYNPKLSVGNLLVGLCLEHACEHGVARYDFLKGSEPYKFHWADTGRSSLSLSISQRKLSPFLFTTGRFIKYTAKILLR